MPKQYPPHFCRDMVNRILAGKSVLSPVQEMSPSEQTLHRWNHQGLVHAGIKDGSDSQESAELRAVNKLITALEKRLQPVENATALFDAKGVVPRKDGRP